MSFKINCTIKRDHPQKISWNLLFSNLIWRKKCWFFCKKSDRLFWRLFHTVLVQYSIARNFCQKLRIISQKRYRSLQTWRPKKLLSIVKLFSRKITRIRKFNDFPQMDIYLFGFFSLTKNRVCILLFSWTFVFGKRNNWRNFVNNFWDLQ